MTNLLGKSPLPMHAQPPPPPPPPGRARARAQTIMKVLERPLMTA